MGFQRGRNGPPDFRPEKVSLRLTTVSETLAGSLLLCDDSNINKIILLEPEFYI